MPKILLQTAQAIAMDWHGGQVTELYSFGSTGQVRNLHRLCAEIQEEIDYCAGVANNISQPKSERTRLKMEEIRLTTLLKYVEGVTRVTTPAQEHEDEVQP